MQVAVKGDVSPLFMIERILRSVSVSLIVYPSPIAPDKAEYVIILTFFFFFFFFFCLFFIENIPFGYSLEPPL